MRNPRQAPAGRAAWGIILIEVCARRARHSHGLQNYQAWSSCALRALTLGWHAPRLRALRALAWGYAWLRPPGAYLPSWGTKRFLNENTQLKLEDFLICGIGGDICDEAPPDYDFGYATTKAQIQELEQHLQMQSSSQPRILLTHIPPCDNKQLSHLLGIMNPVAALCGHTHHWGEEKFNDSLHILILPTCVKGYAVLKLDGAQWNCNAITLEKRYEQKHSHTANIPHSSRSINAEYWPHNRPEDI